MREVCSGIVIEDTVGEEAMHAKKIHVILGVFENPSIIPARPNRVFSCASPSAIAGRYLVSK